ncbi:MAG: hypothetical protein NVSMB45_12830 [Ginsengibacter sp.]
MKKIGILLATVFAIITFVSFTPGVQPDYKNLQILSKDISKHDLDSVMKHFSISLGVKCGYCHARTEDGTHLDFASDAKGEKKISRKMMLMSKSINDTYFSLPNVASVISNGPYTSGAYSSNSAANNNQSNPKQTQMVTCFTCHRGMEQPEAKIPDSLLSRAH